MAVNRSTYDTLYVASTLAVGATRLVVADGSFAAAIARHPDSAVAGLMVGPVLVETGGPVLVLREEAALSASAQAG